MRWGYRQELSFRDIFITISRYYAPRGNEREVINLANQRRALVRDENALKAVSSRTPIRDLLPWGPRRI